MKKIIISGYFICLVVAQNVMAQSDTLSFLHITDLHLYFNPDGYKPEIIAHRNNKQYDIAEGNLREFLNKTPKKTNCNKVIATGDLIDYFEAETPKGNMLDCQVEQFTQLLNDFYVSMYLALGNHDYFSYSWKDDKLKHNQNNSGPARASWIRNNASFKRGTYYRKIFQVGEKTYRLIFLDNGFYQFPPNDSTSVPYIDKSQFYWLNAQLNEDKEDVEIICMHIPFSESVSQKENSNELFSTLIKHPSCKLILSGHFHKNLVSILQSDRNKKLVQVQTGALVRSEENWRLIHLTENNIVVTFPGQFKEDVLIPIN